MLKRIIKFFKRKRFERECPFVRCTCCNYHYFDENDKGRCKLEERLGL